jgi:hypothetical protein
MPEVERQRGPQPEPAPPGGLTLAAQNRSYPTLVKLAVVSEV